MERRALFAAATATVVGYLPDYEYTSALNSTLTKSGSVTQIDYFSVLPDANGLLPGTTVGSLSNTSTKTSGGYNLGTASDLASLVTAAHAAGIKVSIVVGGGGTANTTGLTAVVGGGAALWQQFASSAQQFANTYHLDGIDIDWEPQSLSATDVANYGNTLAALRQANPTLALSAAVDSGQLTVTGGGSSYILNATAMTSLTYVNVMAYDLNPSDVSPIAQAESKFSAWGTYAQSNGISKTKLIFGMPFYGEVNYNALKYSQLMAKGGLQPPTATSVTISGVVYKYNGPSTIAAKTSYSLANGYGGSLAWEVGQDYFVSGNYDSTYSLLPQMKAATASGTGIISGTVLTSSGAPVAGETVYIDVNKSGTLDSGDISTTTSSSGNYSFSNLLIGTDSVGQVVPSGYTQSSPTAGGMISTTVVAAQTTTANFITNPLTPTTIALAYAGADTSGATASLQFAASMTAGVTSGEAVTLKDASNNNATVATGTVSGGVATFTVSAGSLPAGAHSLFASYAGDASFAASQSKAVLAVRTSANGSAVTLSDNGTTSVTVDGVSTSFADSTFTSVVFVGGNGNDTLNLSTTITSPLSIIGGGGADTLNINGGAFATSTDLGVANASLSVNVASGASATWSGSERLASLTINGASSLISNGAYVLDVTSLTLGSSGLLDLSNNSLIVDYSGASPAAAISGALSAGISGGGWNGSTGIVSSAVAGTANTTLGFGEASAVVGSAGGTFAGQAVDGTAVLVRFTYAGDVNLDRTVDISDLTVLASNFGGSGSFSQGDINYDGVVDLSDLVQLASNFGHTLTFSQPAAAPAAKSLSVSAPIAQAAKASPKLAKHHSRSVLV